MHLMAGKFKYPYQHYVNILRYEVARNSAGCRQRYEARQEVKTAFALGTITQAIEFLERRLDLGLVDNEEAEAIYKSILSAGYNVIGSWLEEQDTATNPRLSKQPLLPPEEVHRRLVERSRADRDARAAVPAGLANYRERQHKELTVAQRMAAAFDRAVA